jgi:hypothetical protein
VAQAKTSVLVDQGYFTILGKLLLMPGIGFEIGVRFYQLVELVKGSVSGGIMSHLLTLFGALTRFAFIHFFVNIEFDINY